MEPAANSRKQDSSSKWHTAAIKVSKEKEKKGDRKKSVLESLVVQVGVAKSDGCVNKQQRRR